MQNLARKVFILLFLSLFVFTSTVIYSQPPHRKAMERISTFKKIKLLEILDLKEEQSNKFLIAYSKYEKKERELQEEARETTEDLEKAIRKENEADVKKYLKELVDKKKELLDNMLERHEEFKKMLTEIQFAKYVVFNEKFKHELGRRLLKKGRGKMGRDGGF